MQKCLAAVLVLATLAACAPRRIPGTEIDDTDESRTILAVMEKYRRAMEAKDAEGVEVLLDPTFRDDAGTGTPGDDLDYESMKEVLPKRFARVDNLKLELTVKKITVQDDGTAQAIYNFNTTFRIPALTQKPQNESGLKMMNLLRHGDDWKITSGI